MFPIYVDEDAHQGALIRALRAAGFDCLTVKDTGMRSRSDEEQLQFAADSGRALFTMNTGDFCRLDGDWRRTGRRHSGIIVLTDQLTPIGTQLRAFIELGNKFAPTDMTDRLVFLLNYA